MRQTVLGQDSANDGRRARSTAIVVRGWPGQLTHRELIRLAELGERPRTPYAEVARVLDADVIDARYLAENSSAVARLVGRRVGMVEGQVVETFQLRHRYGNVVAWADRVGLELALLLKIARSRRDLVLVSGWPMQPSKRRFYDTFHVQSHLGAVIGFSSVQLERAAVRYELPREKLHLILQPVDERFWEPTNEAPEDLICSVGCVSGFRDYATLVDAARDLPVRFELAVGSLVLSVADRRRRAERFAAAIPPERLPPNVAYQLDLPATKLRDLYARSRFMVMPLEDVDFDAGITSITEAMSMGKAVIVTRNGGQVDAIRDGVEGIYVPPRDPRALRDAIRYLLENPAVAQRMGAAGRAAVLLRHRLDDYVAKVAAVIQRAAV